VNCILIDDIVIIPLVSRKNSRDIVEMSHCTHHAWYARTGRTSRNENKPDQNKTSLQQVISQLKDWSQRGESERAFCSQHINVIVQKLEAGVLVRWAPFDVGHLCVLNTTSTAAFAATCAGARG